MQLKSFIYFTSVPILEFFFTVTVELRNKPNFYSNLGPYHTTGTKL